MAKWPKFVERGPSVTTFEIAAFEKQFAISLPDDYRQFLLDVNGGRTAKDSREFSEGVLNGVLTLNADADHDFNDLASWNERAQRELETKELVVVGYDDGGARILVAVDGEHRGQVWMQNNGDARPADANPRVLWHDRRDFRKLADGFEQFMASLRPLKA